MQARFFLPLILLGIVHFTSAQNCTADFSFTDDGLTVMFHDESVSDPGDPIVSWFWDFGDGVTSTLQNPAHTFPEAEDYLVCLTIETQSGCVSQVCTEVDICTLIISANVSPNCNANGEIEVTVTISDPFDAARDINVSVDGVLVPGSPFEIEDDQPVILTLFIPGDGLTHTIFAQSIDVGHCNVTYELTTQDCSSNCFLSGLQVQIMNTSTHIVEVADNFFNPDNITVLAGDIVEFQWLDGGHSSTSDATSGPDAWNSGILGAGSTYSVQITNPGLHPYYCIPHGGPGGVGMSGVIVANCPPGGNFDIEISFQTTVAGASGFNLLIDGVVQPGSPFDYQGTGLNTIQFNIAGDGMTHTFEIEDVADPTCVISNNFVAPDCGAAPTCNITLTASQNGPCNVNDNVPYELTIQSINGGQSGFQVFIDGVQTGGNFNYDPSGTTVITIEIPGDGLQHEITATDIEDSSCSGSTMVTPPNCAITCNLTNLTASTGSSNIIPVEVADFEFIPQHVTITSGDIVEFQWTGSVQHTSTSDATSGPDSWDSGLLSAGATFQTPVLSEGVHPYYCIPHGGPGGVGMSGTITVQADCTNGEMAVALTFDAEGTGPTGFNVFVEGSPVPGNPFAYDPSGTNTVVISVPGDGQSHTIEVQDADDPACSASTMITTPDCNASTCQLTALAEVSGPCDGAGVPVSIVVNDIGGGAAGFTLFVDGASQGSYAYSGTGSTEVVVDIPGDGQIHTIEVKDNDDPTCIANTEVETPDCSIVCVLSNLTASTGSTNIIPVGVADFEFIPQHVTITSGDIVEFQWTGSVQHTSTSDATSGPDSWDSGLLSAGATFQTPVLSEGVHPYYCIPHGGPGGVGMSGTITVQADCTNGEVTVALTFDAEGTGPTGFNVFVDGSPVPGNPLNYDPLGTNNVVINVPGDGQSHMIEVQDADDPACSASTMITTPDCNASSCQLIASAEVSGPCDENGNVNLQITVEDVNGSASGFRVRIDGEITDGSPYLYDPSGTTVVNELFNGDGQQHTILIEDLEDGSCTAGDNILLPDCSLECQIYGLEVIPDQAAKHTIEVRDFEYFPKHLQISVGDTVEWVWVGDVAHTSTSDATSGPDSWDSGFLEQGATFSVVIETAGVHPYYCIPHGGPGGVGMSGTITAIADCENDMVSLNIRFLTQGTGQSGYWIAVDGENTTQEPLPYGSGMVQNAQVLVPGDGMLHSIAITDAEDPTCLATIEVETADCHAVECSIALSAVSNGCNAMGKHAIALTLDHTGQGNNGFQVVIDGIPYTGSPFDYDTGSTTTIEILLPGDGDLHQIFIYDIDEISCSGMLQFQSADCTAECMITGFSMDIATNYRHIVEVRDYEFFPKEIDVFTGDTVHFVWVGQVLHTSTSDATTGEDVWNSGLLGSGATFDVVIQNPGMHRYYCIPHGGPGGIGMAGVINAKDVCEDGLFPAEICFTAVNGSEVGFNILLDGNPLNTSPIPYNHQGETCYYTLLPGDSMSHSIYIEDVDNNKCGLDTIFVFPDCGNICFGFEGDFNTTFNHQTLEVNFIPELPDSNQVSWDFGDGSSSVETEPVHQYDTAGYYTACLYISNNDGCTDTVCHDFFVGMFICNPQFLYENNGLSVEFRDSSITSIPVENWIWTFGDGTASEGEAFPVHQYEELGIYNVCLTIQADSCVSTTCQVLDLSSQCLLTGAAFEVEELGGGKFRFTNHSTGNITHYLWGFGDGHISNETNPEHQYAESGTYTVCMLAMDDDNSCSEFTCIELQVVLTGTNDFSSGPGQLIIYPNPFTRDHTSLHLFGWQESDIGRACSIHLYNLQGNRIAGWTGSIERELHLQPGLQLTPGGYFLRVSTSERQYLGKLIVQ